ncbi:hypothetical protein [Peribacillus sp. ACCC06369]|uniref:hypothetical protein n=1 Tax=Peribacillus sp. ACCC06369 TaxID=3055860 RepID=UPI0025A1361B|nr:hypothetical protein [Peribacillus sp. ACCC06369]MDM5359702.1 hypothetical protein [Peribacillus sp. ACCC06369]
MDLIGIFTSLKNNIYAIPQFAWLILLYIYVINSLASLFKNALEPSVIKTIPESLLIYNDIIMKFIDNWAPSFLPLGLLLMYSGVLISFIQTLPYIGSLKVALHAPSGIYLGLWMLIIYITYKSYIIWGSWFLLLLPAIYCITEVVKKLKSKKHGQLYRY